MVSIPQPQLIVICGAESGRRPDTDHCSQDPASVDRMYVLYESCQESYTTDSPSVNDKVILRPMDNWGFEAILFAVLDIMETETAKGNNIQVNLEGTQPYASAAFTACLILRSSNVFPSYGETTIRDHLFLPVQVPSVNEVQSLRVWIDTIYMKKKSDIRAKVTENDIIIAMADRGIEDFICVKENMTDSENRGKDHVTNADKMTYRRNYRGRWVSLQWIMLGPHDNKYRLTDQGKFAALAYHRGACSGMDQVSEGIELLERYGLLVKTVE